MSIEFQECKNSKEAININENIKKKKPRKSKSKKESLTQSLLKIQKKNELEGCKCKSCNPENVYILEPKILVNMIHPPLSVHFTSMPKIDDDRVYTKYVAPVLKQSTLKFGG